MQEPQVFPILSARLLHLQSVVSPPKGHARIHVLPVHVTRERPRLTHQPVDHMPIIDPVLRLATQPLHRLHPRMGVPHLDLLGTDARFHPLPSQPRRHRVNVLLHLDRAALAHPHPLAFQRLQSAPWQRTQPRLLLLEFVGHSPIPPGHQLTHKLPIGLATDKVPVGT